MCKNTCQNCKYYYQHYAFSQGKLQRVFCGHCAFGRVRTKRPYTSACENYIYAEPTVAAFVSKEYLSKKLLQYVLDLPLLPPIEDGEKW